MPLGTGLEVLRGSSHHSRRKCFALIPCRNLAEPETEGIDDARHSHRVRGRRAISRSSRGSTTDLDLRTKIGDDKGDIRNRYLERRLLKRRGVQAGVVLTHDELSCRTRDVEVNARCRVVRENWMQNWSRTRLPYICRAFRRRCQTA